MTGKAPIHRIRYGTVNCSIFCSTTSIGAFFDVSVTRSYRRDQGWAHARHFGEYDLPVLAKVILDAHSWIQAHKTPEVVNLSLPEVEDDADADTRYGADDDPTDLKTQDGQAGLNRMAPMMPKPEQQRS